MPCLYPVSRRGASVRRRFGPDGIGGQADAKLMALLSRTPFREGLVAAPLGQVTVLSLTTTWMSPVVALPVAVLDIGL
jgi:hypothetical protein